MLIDWFTVGVQILNFLILIALLKRFLYGPIIRAMNEREQTIADRLRQAETERAEAAEQSAGLAEERHQFQLARIRLEQEAREEIGRWKEESLERIKQELAGQQATWKQELDEAQELFLQKLKIEVSRQVLLVARRAIADLADSSIEERLLQRFAGQLADQADGSFPIGSQERPIQIVTGFPLDDSSRDQFRSRLRPFFPAGDNPGFQLDESLGLGIRLQAGDRKWEWNLNRYMHDLEQELIDSMNKTLGNRP